MYAIPLNSVMESLMLDYKQIRTIERREVITLRDQTLPLVRLEDIFSLQRPPEMPEPQSGYVVVVALAQNRLGLLVDDLVGQQDIVIKSLGKTLQGIPGIAGATELVASRPPWCLMCGRLPKKRCRVFRRWRDGAAERIAQQLRWIAASSDRRVTSCSRRADVPHRRRRVRHRH